MLLADHLKKVSAILFVVLTLVVSTVLIPVNTAEAHYSGGANQLLLSEPLDVNVIDIGGRKIIVKYDDGRVQPLDPVGLNRAQLEFILHEMGFNLDEIKSLSFEFMAAVVREGGKKVELTIEEETATIHSSAEVPKSSITISQPSISLFTTFGGTTQNGQEYRYNHWVAYNWHTFPHTFPFAYWDRITLAWDNYAISGDFSIDQAMYRSGSNWYNADRTMTVRVYGTDMKFDLKGTSNIQEGYIMERVHISTSRYGKTGTFVYGYANPWTVVIPSVSIGPASISYGGFIGQEFSGRVSFTVGE